MAEDEQEPGERSDSSGRHGERPDGPSEGASSQFDQARCDQQRADHVRGNVLAGGKESRTDAEEDDRDACDARATGANAVR